VYPFLVANQSITIEELWRLKDFKPNPSQKEAISLDRSLLDLFYQFCGFVQFRKMFELAQDGRDEGSVCNLGLISQYLSRFMDQYSPVITAS
jgi:DNA helicase-2/ATP-dependent DNA helicase PcrA